MFYGLEVCPINKSQIASLEFAVTGALMKVFCTRDKEVVNYCRHMFNFPTVCAAIYRRKYKFLDTYCKTLDNVFCDIFFSYAQNELLSLCSVYR